MSLFAIAYASFKRLHKCRNFDLEIILVNEEQLYKSLNRTDYLSFVNLPDKFQLGPIFVCWGTICS